MLARSLALFCSICSVLADQPFSISWTNNLLRVSGPNLPGEYFEVWYLEAFCRSGSTSRDWDRTTIPHQTSLFSATTNRIRLVTKVEPSVTLNHEITATNGVVNFLVTAQNHGEAFVDVQWFQPCMRVDRFTGRKQDDYHTRSFIFTEAGLKFLHELPRSEEAIYKGGQVYVPAGISREDVNPRPISINQPINGWIGCVSQDNKWLLATAWSKTQELFQGVIVCLHNDPRIGGLLAGEQRTLRGKIVVLPNDPQALLGLPVSDQGADPEP